MTRRCDDGMIVPVAGNKTATTTEPRSTATLCSLFLQVLAVFSWTDAMADPVTVKELIEALSDEFDVSNPGTKLEAGVMLTTMYLIVTQSLRGEIVVGADIRKRVLTRDRSRCFGCGGSASQVHHESYTKANLAGTSLENLVSICRPCHELIEFDGEVKVSPTVATRRLHDLRAKHDAEFKQRLEAKQKRKQERQQRREAKPGKKPQEPPRAPRLPSILQRAKQEADRARKMLEEHRRKSKRISGDTREFKPYLGSPSKHDDMQKRRKK